MDSRKIHKMIKHKTLDAKLREATWVGYTGKSAEHIVVLPDGGPAIKVRTVRSRPASERWNGEAVKQIRATPDAPNPRDLTQTDPRSERETKGLDFGARGGQDLPRQRVQVQPDLKREFRITERLLMEYGFTAGCQGCEAKLMGQANRLHSHECRARLEEAMRAAGPDEEVLERRDARLRRNPGRRGREPATVRAQDQVPEHPPEQRAAEQPEPEAAKRKNADADEGQEDDQPAKRQRLAEVARRQRIESSVKQVMEDLIRNGDQGIRALCTREALTTMVDELDRLCTRKVLKKIAKDSSEAEPRVQTDEAEILAVTGGCSSSQEGLQGRVLNGPHHQ